MIDIMVDNLKDCSFCNLFNVILSFMHEQRGNHFIKEHPTSKGDIAVNHDILEYIKNEKNSEENTKEVLNEKDESKKSYNSNEMPIKHSDLMEMTNNGTKNNKSDDMPIKLSDSMEMTNIVDNITDYDNENLKEHIPEDNKKLLRTKIENIQDLIPEEDGKVSKLKMFSCKQCEKSFVHKNSFKRHNQRRHNSIFKKPAQSHRSKRYYRKKTLRAQLAKAQNCGCNFTFENEKDTLLHYRKDHLNVPSFPCPQCKNAFSVFDHSDLLENHIAKMGHNIYNCQHCNYVCTQERDFSLHMKTVHPDSDILERICQECNFTCLTKGAFIRHQRYYHPLKGLEDSIENESKIQCCELCGKESRNLKEHMNIHSDTHKKWPCSQCAKEFSTKHTARKHEMEMHNAMPLMCGQCPKTFGGNRRLRAHIRNIHTPDSEKLYKCNMCAKGFQSKGTLSSHMSSMHLKDTPFICRYDTCEKAYNDCSNRNNHERKVHGSLHFSAVEANKKANKTFDPVSGKFVMSTQNVHGFK